MRIRHIFLISSALVMGFISSTFAASSMAQPQAGSQYTQQNISIPQGYSLVYLYRGHDQTTQNQIANIYFNDSQVTTLGDNSYTMVFIKPGKYDVNSSPWHFHSNINLAAGKTYYLDFSLKSVSEIDKSTADKVEYYQLDNKDYLIGTFVAKSQSAANSELSQCRYVPPVAQYAMNNSK